MRRLLMPLFILLLALPAAAQTVAERTRGLQKLDGYVPLYWDAASGKMLMEVSRFNQEFLYQVSLAAGLGSNPVGLDRGQMGQTRIVIFERVGPKVLLVEPNYRYRALSNDANERRAVEESFARSVLWGFKVEAAEADRVLVDATAFFLRDAHGVVDVLRRTRQGQYRLDESRSAFYLPRTKAFPLNTEVETQLTFATEGDAGPQVRDVTPTPAAITVREHHSFVQLPDDGYKPRRLDPRVGVFGITFYDYASPITEPIEKRWISRHRLQKKDPNAAVSEPIKPIIYYVDPGAPEPIRSALIEGASWWNQAFEAAGFKNAFQVRVLPEGADPMDLRYNMINWVHRSTRGWSYGGGVTDPRTGEIIKGNVTLGSLRIRQDYMIGTGLVPPGQSNQGEDDECQLAASPDVDYLLAADSTTDSAAMSLARIRQLAAHETGHTLGLAHNFAASTYGRASVMDYPAPMVEIKNGKLDLSNAYAVGIGAYDKFAITYAYAQFPQGADEAAELEKIVEDGVAHGMLFISDADARPPGAAHPLASLWDNGSDPVAMLRHEMQVRRIGLADFGLQSIKAGTPLSLLEAKLLPLYLHHRYQLQAAVKSVGGLYYTYAVKTAAGTNPAPVQAVVPAARQREALDAVLDTIKVEELAIPQRILDLIPPRAFGYEGGPTEYFSKRSDPAFDPVAAATIAADFAVSGLLEQHRAARLIDYHARNTANPDFKEVVRALVTRTWRQPAAANAYQAAIARAVQSLVVTRLMGLAADDDAAPQVRAVATEELRALSAWLATPASATLDAAHVRATRDDIERFLNRPDATRKQTAPLPVPPGDPIGTRSHQ
ncbi:MAG TPA: zinc-dependent metalloprotease [Blastocatellia bacterium]|nr:zinc-dependent metalloprotease [Blastocatellia bacterium]